MGLRYRCDSLDLRNDLVGNQDVGAESLIKPPDLVNYRDSHLPLERYTRKLKLTAQTTPTHCFQQAWAGLPVHLDCQPNHTLGQQYERSLRCPPWLSDFSVFKAYGTVKPHRRQSEPPASEPRRQRYINRPKD